MFFPVDAVRVAPLCEYGTSGARGSTGRTTPTTSRPEAGPSGAITSSFISMRWTRGDFAA